MHSLCFHADHKVLAVNGTSVTLADVLAFFMAYDNAPPHGFKKPPTMKFVDSATATGNTCLSILSVPVVHTSYESFKEYMTESVLSTKFNLS